MGVTVDLHKAGIVLENAWNDDVRILDEELRDDTGTVQGRSSNLGSTAPANIELIDYVGDVVTDRYVAPAPLYASTLRTLKRLIERNAAEFLAAFRQLGKEKGAADHVAVDEEIAGIVIAARNHNPKVWIGIDRWFRMSRSKYYELIAMSETGANNCKVSTRWIDGTA